MCLAAKGAINVRSSRSDPSLSRNSGSPKAGFGAVTQGYALPCSTRADTARDQWPAVAFPTLDLWDGRSSQQPSHRVTDAGVIFLAPPPTGRLRGKVVLPTAVTRT